jgi:hypothetical protein
MEFNLGFKGLMSGNKVAALKIRASFRHLTPWYGVCCFCIQSRGVPLPWRWKKPVFPKRLYLSTKLRTMRYFERHLLSVYVTFHLGALLTPKKCLKAQWMKQWSPEISSSPRHLIVVPQISFSHVSKWSVCILCSEKTSNDLSSFVSRISGYTRA